MEFLKLLEEIKREHQADTLVRRNGTLILSPGTVPKARHMFFEPLTDEEIQEQLVSQYVNEFPQEYIEILKYTNGCDLYWLTLHTLYQKRKKTVPGSQAGSVLTIYGLPRVPAYDRPKDEEEPYDLRVEDMDRPGDLIPETWLAFGCCRMSTRFGDQASLYIDTVTHHVHACVMRKGTHLKEWNSLEECLREIMTMAEAFPKELFYDINHELIDQV